MFVRDLVFGDIVFFFVGDRIFVDIRFTEVRVSSSFGGRVDFEFMEVGVFLFIFIYV